MEVRNCRECKKIFNYLGGPELCPSCIRKADEKFAQVKEYVYDHPRCGIQEVADANEVSTATIRRWIREEKLAFSDDSPVGLTCEHCGTMIKTGRYCKECKAKMIHSFGSMYQDHSRQDDRKNNSHDRAKMRFLDS